MKNLVIVAHPDDETIWMGGTILKNKNIDWTVVCLCRKNDSDRKPKFEKVCRDLKAHCLIGDLDDEKLLPLTIKEVSSKLISLLPEYKFDYIYTHGENGEYGHIRHKEIHMAVKKLVEEKKLICKKLFSFDYVVGNKSVPAIPKLKVPEPNLLSDLNVTLNERDYKRKVSLVKDIYGFGGESFEVLSCNNVETFKIVS